ncbi:MAG: AAA family ATPase [Nocardiopsaceae bacterium]|nr:AAA family ATPase [Nocardiopsaceae bacterium]
MEGRSPARTTTAGAGKTSRPPGLREPNWFRGGDWLVRAIKIAVDEDPRPGQFILPGSSRFLSVPTLSESLAGRAAFVDLWPLSMAEQTGGPADFVTRLFRDPASLRDLES